MNPTVVGFGVFLCTLAGALAGFWLRRRLPGHHLDEESRDTMKLGIGLIATMTALVLGLVTASAKNAFDTVETQVHHTAMDILSLNRLLVRYGPETAEIRSGLHRLVERRIGQLWPSDGSGPHWDLPDGGEGPEEIADRIRRLAPADDLQRGIQSRAQDVIEALLQTRWMALAGKHSAVLPPFLLVLICWLMVTFACFGLYAPRNLTARMVLLVCALSVSSAFFLILELDSPFQGLLQVSPDPLRYALTNLRP